MPYRPDHRPHSITTKNVWEPVMHSMEKYLAEEPFALRRSERSDINVNDRIEIRHYAQELGVDEQRLIVAVERAGLSGRAVQAQLGCC